MTLDLEKEVLESLGFQTLSRKLDFFSLFPSFRSLANSLVKSFLRICFESKKSSKNNSNLLRIKDLKYLHERVSNAKLSFSIETVSPEELP